MRVGTVRKSLIVLLTGCFILLASNSLNAQVSNYFPYGLFEDGNLWNMPQTLQNDLNIIKSKGITDILFTNSTPNIDIFDSNGISVVAAPMRTLNSEWWWNYSAVETLDRAKAIAATAIAPFLNHPSVRAYNLVDDAGHYSDNKISLMVQAVNQLDPAHPASVMMPHNTAFLASNPPFYLSYSYPAKTTNIACDFNSRSYMGQYVNNYAQLLEVRRENLQLNERNIPYWAVLQTHGTSPATNPNPPDINNLRTPAVEEVRMQNWDALAEGVRGIYWFIFNTQQFWQGLKDNAPLFNEVSSLAARVKPLTSTLLNLVNYDQQLFTVTSANTLPFANQPLIRTLVSKDGSRWYVVVVNHSCATQTLTINSSYSNSGLRDAETGTVYSLGQGIS
jgi:hypothetical protein